MLQRNSSVRGTWGWCWSPEEERQIRIPGRKYLGQVLQHKQKLVKSRKERMAQSQSTEMWNDLFPYISLWTDAHMPNPLPFTLPAPSGLEPHVWSLSWRYGGFSVEKFTPAPLPACVTHRWAGASMDTTEYLLISDLLSYLKSAERSKFYALCIALIGGWEGGEERRERERLHLRETLKSEWSVRSLAVPEAVGWGQVSRGKWVLE